jgi:hypothetical protein
MNLDNMFYIKDKDWYLIQSWAKLAYDEDKNEVSGIATAVPNNKGEYIISDIEILKQENSGTNTELEGDAVTDYKMRYALKYKNPDMKYVWWHSHHTMEAFWSSTDKTEINAWKNNSFSLALVVNLKEEYLFRVSVWKASNLEIEEHYDIPLHIIRKGGVQITDKMKKEYKELCSDKHVGYVTGNKGGYATWGQQWHRGHMYNGSQVISNNQLNLLDKENNDNVVDMKIYEAWKQTLECINDYNDEFMQGEITFKDYKDELKSLQDALIKENITKFKIKSIKGTKHQLMGFLMTSIPNDFVEFKDNDLKLVFEQYEDSFNVWY